MKKYLYLMMAACLTIFSMTSCDPESDNGGTGSGDNGNSSETEWSVAPEFKENGNTMSLTYQTFYGSQAAGYAVNYSINFTFSNGVCTKANIALTCKDKTLAKELYNYIKMTEEDYSDISLDGNTIKADVTEDYKGMKQEYLRSYCKYTVDIYKIASSDDPSYTEKKKAYCNVTDNKISAFYGSYGFSIAGEEYQEFEFQQDVDWNDEPYMACCKATSTYVFPTENIAEYFYRTEYLHEDDPDYYDDMWGEGDTHDEPEVKLDGKKIIEDETSYYSGDDMDEILDNVMTRVESFNKYLDME